MKNNITHNWQPSARLRGLAERTQNTPLIERYAFPDSMPLIDALETAVEKGLLPNTYARAFARNVEIDPRGVAAQLTTVGELRRELRKRNGGMVQYIPKWGVVAIRFLRQIFD